MANDDILISISEEPDAVLHIIGNYVGSAYSPQVEVTETDAGHTVAITYDDAEDGITTTEFAVSDGEDYVLTDRDRDEIGGIVLDDLSEYVRAMEQATTRANTAEQARATAEAGRATAEQARQSAETGRETAEGIRTQAEAQRAENERQRASSEQSRATAEQARATAEQGRVTAEQARASAETARAGEWATLKADATTATSAANAAASSASTAEADLRAAAARGDFDGYSPTVAIASTTDEHTVTITDADGPHSYAVPTYASEEAARAEEWADLKEDAEAATEAAQEAATELAPEVKWLWGNQLKNSLSGELMQASDAYGAPLLSLGVDGKSEQIQTTGKNLLSDRAEDWVSKTIPNGSTRNCLFIAVDDGESYHYHRNSYQKWNFSSAWCNDTDFADYTAITVLTNLADYTFTNSSNFNYLLIYASTLPSSDEMVASNLQVEVGDTFTSYEPYTGGKPSPSPDYPQPILSVDNPSLELSTWNLYDLSATPTSESWAVSGPQVTHTGAWVSIFCGKTPTLPERLEHCPILPAGTYTFSFTHVSGDAGFSVYPINDSGGAGERLVFILASYVSFTLNETTRIDILFRGNGVESNLMLNAGSTALAYMPYKGPITTVPLYDDTLRSLPDGTKDTLTLSYLRPSSREGWAWYSRELTHRCGQMNGYNDVSYVGNFGTNANGSLWYITPTPAIAPCIASTNAAENVGYSSTCTYLVAGTNNVDHVYCHGARLYIRTAEVLADSAAAVAWTNAHKPIVVYKLATPTTETLDPIELPVLPAPECTVWSDPTTGMQMEYVQDTNIVIASLQAALADLATS